MFSTLSCVLLQCVRVAPCHEIALLLHSRFSVSFLSTDASGVHHCPSCAKEVTARDRLVSRAIIMGTFEFYSNLDVKMILPPHPLDSPWAMGNFSYSSVPQNTLRFRISLLVDRTVCSPFSMHSSCVDITLTPDICLWIFIRSATCIRDPWMLGPCSSFRSVDQHSNMGCDQLLFDASSTVPPLDDIPYL